LPSQIVEKACTRVGKKGYKEYCRVGGCSLHLHLAMCNIYFRWCPIREPVV